MARVPVRMVAEAKTEEANAQVQALEQELSTLRASNNTTAETKQDTSNNANMAWTLDNASSICTICNVSKFTLLKRRHHSRKCGRLCCASCGPKRKVKNSKTTLRICVDCNA